VDLAPSASQVITVRFDPVTAQTFNASVTFSSSGAGVSRIVSGVSGTGVPL
jgi:hypothetical protein